MKYIVLYLLVINALDFILMLVDKYKAKHKLWRIPEFVLLSFAAIGGAIGGFFGMKIAHHKTRHMIFRVGLPVMIAIHAIILWDLNRLGVLRRL